MLLHYIISSLKKMKNGTNQIKRKWNKWETEQIENGTSDVLADLQPTNVQFVNHCAKVTSY